MELCVALDLPSAKENLALAESLKSYDVWMKVGFRTYIRDGKPFIEALKAINPDFKIFLDLKLYDIPNTMADAAEEIAKLGVDMQADDAMFFYRPVHRYIRPIHFSPWIVSKYEPQPQRDYAKAKRSVAMQGEMAMAVMPVAKYLNAREYQIKDLSLPSTGMPIDVQVTQWKAPLECGIHVYPYRNTTAFHTCVFEPKLQIDNNQWKVKAAQSIINDNAVGEYRKDKYALYTQAELDIKVERRPIVKREKTTGIFGGTARKKDGFSINVTNKSDKPRTVTVTERIPTSTTEEIKVKLLEIKSDKKVNHKLLKDGEIEMKLILAAHENQKIEVLFEISYDKDLKVSY